MSVESVIAASDYWEPPPTDRLAWLVEEVLPAAFKFLTEHSAHTLAYLEEEHFDSNTYRGYQQVSAS